MLIIFILTSISLCSCINNPRVEYMSGEVGAVRDKMNIGESGDTIVVKHYIHISTAGVYSDDVIWGIYRGSVPKDIFSHLDSSDSRTWYEIAVKQ